MVDHIEGGSRRWALGSSRKKGTSMYIIIVSAKERRALIRLPIHSSSDMPNTNLTTP